MHANSFAIKYLEYMDVDVCYMNIETLGYFDSLCHRRKLRGLGRYRRGTHFLGETSVVQHERP